jgi:hypothetical protein
MLLTILMKLVKYDVITLFNLDYEPNPVLEMLTNFEANLENVSKETLMEKKT